MAYIDGESQAFSVLLNKHKKMMRKKKSRSRRKLVSQEIKNENVKIDKNLENQIRALKTTAKQIRHKTP